MSRQRRRWLAMLGAFLFGVLAIFSGADRLSEMQPAMARLVPDAFRAGAWRVAAVGQLTRGGKPATSYAGNAVSADPLDPRGPSFLAAALLTQGDRTRAADAFAVADRLGMREPLVQAFYFDEAAAKSDFREAARRLDIILRAHPRLASISHFFTVLEASDAGRAELANRLFADPRWAAAYLSDFRASDEVLRSRARFLSANARYLNVGCEPIDALVRELAKRNFRADAKDLAAAFCEPASSDNVLADADFERFGADDPFGWRRHGSGDVRIEAIGGSEKSIEIDNRANVTRLVLSQPVTLTEGSYDLHGTVSGAGKGRITASLGCGSVGQPSAAGSLSTGQRITAPSCPDQVLGIWVRPGEGTVRLASVRLTEAAD